MSFDVIICFETHVELDTQTKLFCGCLKDPEAAPNTNICPICTGHPGTLPYLNKKAVEYAVRVGLALNCKVHPHARFARKNYFYPDLPKGYQISQYELPFCTDGSLEIFGDDGQPYRVGIKRVHLEEDAGKLVYPSGSFEGAPYSLVDFNRAGVPLVEIVGDHTRNPIRSVREARFYLEKLKQVLQYIGVSRCRMERGELRCDANVSLRPKGQPEFGHRVEMKNMASFKLILEALEYEIRRQSRVLRTGGTVQQETRLYDQGRKETIPMRSKEDAPDYRYFPEPDLVGVELDKNFLTEVRKRIPELPDQKIKHLIEEFGIPWTEAVVLAREKEVSEYFTACASFCPDRGRLAHWIVKELFKLLNQASLSMKECPVKPMDFSQLINLLSQGLITEPIGRAVLEEMFSNGETAQYIIDKKGLKPIEDPQELRTLVNAVAQENAGAVEQIRKGEVKPVRYLVGQIMKKTGGRADPKKAGRMIRDMFLPGDAACSSS